MKGKTVFFLSAILFCLSATFIGYGNNEAAAAQCTGGTLPPGGGEDLLVTGPCTVGAGISRYGNVNIIAGGILTFTESANAHTHFWAKSILVENNGSLIAGTPAAPIGTLNGTLTIHLYGGDADKAGIQCQSPVVGGAPCGIPAAIWDQNPPPTSASCTKVVLPGGVSDCFYPYMPPDNIAGETGMFGRKVLAVSYGGTLQLFGQKGATYTAGVQNWDSGKSWVRLRNHNSRPGENVLNLDRAVDWKPGDRVVVTTTDYLPGHSEEFQIISVDPTADQITIGKIDSATNQLPVACSGSNPPETCKAHYAHNGDLYLLDNLPDRLNIDGAIRNGGMDNGAAAAETRAAVALLTRSIRVVSGGDTIPTTQAGMTCDYNCFPVSDGFYGGHTIALEGFNAYQVQGVEFYQLGQGGRKARYPVHFHLARKTPATTFVNDCSVHDSMTRWYTLHGTQGVTLARNVGYLSIGHGYYLEDGTETDNNFYSNIGIFARAAISNTQNPRNVPGILAGGSKTSANPPFNSDFANPTVFWIMNGWNDFQYNMAVGANACGACYWLLPGLISTHSRNMVWESYASIQKIIPGGAPLQNFVGNYCSSAQLSFNTVQATDACNGLAELGPINNSLAPAPPNPDYYPQVSGLRQPTLCTGTCSNNLGQPCTTDSQCNPPPPAIPENTCTSNCTQTPPCGVQNPGAPFDARDFCPVTVLDRYTSSFHWPEKNFAAIWLRGKWMLLSNSVLSDSQNGGLGLVTGGDYTLSSVIPGNWQTAIRSVFIGNTQKAEDNPLASNAGPFNPLVSTDKKIKGLSCDNTVNRSLFCLSKGEGITMPISNFSMQQRLFNVYDGPNYQDSNAYLDITKTDLESQCTPDDCPAVSGWMYTAAQGIPIDQESGPTRSKRNCILPNAAIGWKQPNGFYYPPAFHSKNLYFNNVDIRHLVIEPLWKPGTFESDLTQVKENYCTYDPTPTTPTTKNQTFTGFTGVDRQTVLNDDDGSLTGLLSPVTPAAGETISVNLDPFFTAPVEAPECASFDLSINGNTTGGTANTSPYQYVSTVVYPACVVEKNCGGHCSLHNEPCARDGDCPPPLPNEPAQRCLNATWGEACSDPSCYGVPLSRQMVTTPGDNNLTIPMMGMGFSQRSMLTANNGTYYMDTTVSAATQKKGLGGPVPITSLNVFQPGASYYVFFVYPNELTKQKYQIYIGSGISEAEFNANMSNYITPVRVDIRSDALKFVEDVTWNGLTATINGGLVTVSTDFSEFNTDFDATAADYCRPKEFCQLVGGTCQTSLDPSDPLHDVSQQICANIAGKDIDCPLFQFPGPTGMLPGCIGFKITLGDSKQFGAYDVNHRPVPCCFPQTDLWKVTMSPQPIAGACSDTIVPGPQFCNPACSQ